MMWIDMLTPKRCYHSREPTSSDDGSLNCALPSVQYITIIVHTKPTMDNSLCVFIKIGVILYKIFTPHWKVL